VAVTGDDDDGIEAAPDSVNKQKAALSAKAPAASSAVVIGDSTKEIAAGQLKASADTETGTKQRKVNKRLQEYGSTNATEPKKDA
jgi:phosphoglycolate phosphatase-like HAD superfamily hydrolase